MPKTGKILSYDELLQKHSEWTLWDTRIYGRESTPEATEAARIRCLREIGYVVKFIQDHGLTRKVLCATAPEIPEDFRVYLRDIKPEGLEFYRTGYMKWLKRFERNMHADPSDVSIMEKSLAELRRKVMIVETSFKSEAPSNRKIGNRKTKAPFPFKTYDDISWHIEGDFPEGLDSMAACTHIGMFLAWAILNDMASTDHIAAFGDSIEQLRQHKMTPGQYVMSFCNGKLTSEDLNHAANEFACQYYDINSGGYIGDYESLLSNNLQSTYHVSDSWENYEKLQPAINNRFQEHRNRAAHEKA